VFLRFAAMAALTTAGLFAQADALPALSPPPAVSGVPELTPDMDDPNVIRAQRDLDRVKLLIGQGAIPAMRLRAANEDLQNALDMSILRANLFGKDLLPEQADQMVTIAQKMVLRKQRSMIEMQQLVSSGVISRAEAEASGADFDRAQTELHLAETRARLMQQMAESLRIQKMIASYETQAESHPDWAGKVYTKFDGNGIFRRDELSKIEFAFTTKFAKPLPISADGETALHRSLGFDHRGRVDVAISPDQPEGLWLMKYLQTNRIPFLAFRMAVPGMATGAHIHIGTSSTKLVSAD
jgi:multidrug resistance efflux pump